MPPTFEGWARVELFGHRVVFGHVTEVTMFGATFARIEVPTEPPTVEFKSAQAIYGLTPRTEDECRKQNEPWKPRPALSAPEDADLVEVDPDTVCGGCGKPIRVGDSVEDVEVDNDDLETWHLQCAQERAEPNDDLPPDPVDTDAPKEPL